MRISDWSSDVCSSDLAPRGDAIGQVLKVAHPARGDHRNGDSVGYRTRQFKVEARLGAVAVHAGQQQFAGAVVGHFLGPLYRVDAGGLASAVSKDFPSGGLVGSRYTTCIDGYHDALRAVVIGGIAHQFGIDRKSTRLNSSH